MNPLRFIPVGAGNSGAQLIPFETCTVYPRGCGELRSIDSLFHDITGLSPWVRGTLNLRAFGAFAARFIPVGAGNSHATGANQVEVTVYPRGCGELSMSID